MILAVVATFLTVWVTDFLIHQVWLGQDYAATKSLWRPVAEMMAKMHWMFIGQLVVALGIAILYVKAMADTATRSCALGFGLCLGLITSGGQLIMYVVAPYPGALVAKWIVSYMIQGFVVGQVLYQVCKRRDVVA